MIQLGAVGDDQHTRIGHLLADPLGQPDHGQRLARSLGVPDDAAFPLLEALLRGAHAEILIVSAGLLDAGVEDHKVVDQFEKAVLLGQAQQGAVKQIAAAFAFGTGEVFLVRRVTGLERRVLFFPVEVILFRRFDDAVAQALGVIAGHDELDRSKEPTNEGALLVIEVLADALSHRHRGTLEFQHAQGDAVHIQHDVRALLVLALDGHLFGDGEVILFWVLPVYEPDRLVLFAGAFFYFHTVTQEFIDGAVGVVEAFALTQGRGLAKLM